MIEKAYLNDNSVTNTPKSFTHKMVAKTSWLKLNLGQKLKCEYTLKLVVQLTVEPAVMRRM